MLELHIGFESEYQGKGFFQDALVELYEDLYTPIYISKGRVINSDVFKAIAKLDHSKLNVEESEYGYVITGKD